MLMNTLMLMFHSTPYLQTLMSDQWTCFHVEHTLAC